jgi:hypothetical protein
LDEDATRARRALITELGSWQDIVAGESRPLVVEHQPDRGGVRRDPAPHLRCSRRPVPKPRSPHRAVYAESWSIAL